MFTIYGHRGLLSKAPENTLASYKKAADIPGLKWIELDVAITKDEQLVIIHDDFLDRTTDMTGEVTQLDYMDIKMLRLAVGLAKHLKLKDCRLLKMSSRWRMKRK